MYVTIVDVWVKEAFIADFIAACHSNHLASIQEAGNHRFDILQQADDPTHFVLYEAYQDNTSAQAHKGTAHYLAWRDQVAEMMDKPRKGTVYQGLYPNPIPDQRPSSK